LDVNKSQLICWEANDEILRKRMLLVKRSVSEQGNQAPALSSGAAAARKPQFTQVKEQGADIVMQSSQVL
jgi:hypothetical protein